MNPMMLKAWGMGFKKPPETMESVKVAGRLAYLVNTWKVLTKDTLVLNTIQGYQIPLTGKPLQHQRPSESAFSKEQAALSERGNSVPLAEGSHFSHLKGTRGLLLNNFPSAQKNGQMRPVINLKCLHQWVEAPYFKMEGIATLKDLLRPGDWMVKVDMKDAYFTIPIHLHHQQFLRFRVEGQCYQFTYLPFGLSCAPWTFMKVMKPLMTLLRSWGIRIIVYIDDMLVMARTREEANQHMEVLVFLQEALGFIVNQEKSHLIPAQELEFLRLSVDSQSLQL